MKTTVVKLLLLFCFPYCGTAQLSHYPKDSHSVPFKIYKTEKDTISIDELGKLPFKDVLLADKTNPTDTYWAKLDFSNHESLLTSNSMVLHIGYIEKAEIFYRDGNKIKSEILGSFQLNEDFTGEFPINRQLLIDEHYLYLKFTILNVHSNLHHKSFVLYDKENQKYWNNYVLKRKSDTYNLIYFFLGSALVAVIMALVFYRIHKKHEYLYYALYVIGLMLSFGTIPSGLYDKYIGLLSLNNSIIEAGLNMLITICYLLFVRSFINTQEKYPILNKVISVYVLGLIVFIVLGTYFMASWQFGLYLVLLDIKMIALAVIEVFGIAYLIAFRKDKLTWFIVAGGAFFCFGTILTFWYSNTNFIKAAAFVEIFVFFIGLGYKVRTENEEKSRIQEVSIQNYRKLLRAQINPHFIFNSLNSIQNLMTSDNKVPAIKYLGKFSKLLRLTLENSMDNHVLLADEIQFIKTYLELESLRFDESFQYNIFLAEDISPEDIEVPQLMIQPFVENAILHGLLNKKEGEKILNISFSMDNDFLMCSIDDNGIGRKALKPQGSHKSKPSRGMEVTQNRINIIFAQAMEQKLLTVIDKTDVEGNPKGTTVLIKVPINK